MTHRPAEPDTQETLVDGFAVLDGCHRQTVFALGKLAALLTRLDRHGEDDAARELASEVVRHFGTTARLHHEDEELHVFPRLADDGDERMRDAVARLKQDHAWIEHDWSELEPQLQAVAEGQSWWDLDRLRETADIFIALAQDHIALEESLIYPQVRTRVPDRDRRDMAREMAARRQRA